jgi:hypothetical protein
MIGEIDMSEATFNDEPSDSGEADAQETLDALGSGNEMTFVTGETKKPVNKTTMVLFAIIALGGGGLWLMHARTGPQTASAGTADTANKTINQFLTGGQSNIKTMEQMLRNTEKVVQQFNTYPSVKQIPLTELQTNPFRATAPSANQDDDPIAKRKLAEQLETIQKSYQTLQLQSIMFGSKSSCLINNTLYREGQIVNGFTIEKISQDTVTVKQDKWRFDLKMAK